MEPDGAWVCAEGASLWVCQDSLWDPHESEQRPERQTVQGTVGGCDVIGLPFVKTLPGLARDESS